MGGDIVYCSLREGGDAGPGAARPVLAVVGWTALSVSGIFYKVNKVLPQRDKVWGFTRRERTEVVSRAVVRGGDLAWAGGELGDLQG